MVERRKYEQNGNGNNCPGSKLEVYLYCCLNPQTLKKLRAYEPEDGFSKRNRLEAVTYRSFNEISRKLYQFIEPELIEFQCNDEDFRVLSKEELKERMTLADRVIDMDREYILARLTEHVAECRICFSEYKNILKAMARLRIQTQGVRIKSQRFKRKNAEKYYF